MTKKKFNKAGYTREPFIPIDNNDNINQQSGNAFETGSRHPKWRGGVDNETKRNRAKTYTSSGIGFFPVTNSSAGAAKHAQAKKVKINKSPLHIGAPKFTLLDEIRAMRGDGELYRKRNARKMRRLHSIELKQSQALAKKFKKTSNSENFIRGLNALTRRHKDK